MVDIFDEVSEDLRAERAHRLLRRYGPYVIAAAVLVVAAAAAWQSWIYYRNRQDIAAATVYIAAIRAPAPGAAPVSPATVADLEKTIAISPADGYRTLARLRLGSVKADQGDLAGAAALWDQVAADPNAEPLLRDFASLAAIRHELETADPAILESRLQPLRQLDNAWHGLADETAAMLAMRQGKTDQAREILKQLSQDTTALPSTRERAAFLLGRIGA